MQSLRRPEPKIHEVLRDPISNTTEVESPSKNDHDSFSLNYMSKKEKLRESLCDRRPIPQDNQLSRLQSGIILIQQMDEHTRTVGKVGAASREMYGKDEVSLTLDWAIFDISPIRRGQNEVPARHLYP